MVHSCLCSHKLPSRKCNVVFTWYVPCVPVPVDFFSWLPWTHTLGLCSPMVAGVLGVCHAMPGSGAVYGGCTDCSYWEKPLTELEQRHFLSVQSLRCATGLKTLGKFLHLFSLPLLNVKENTWEYYLHCGWWEIMVVIWAESAHHPSAQVCKQTGCQGMMWLVELAWNFSERAVPWTWQGDVWHGSWSWIYRTDSPKQTKDMTSFLLLPYLIGVFLHKSLFSARLQNTTKPFCGHPAMRRRCNSPAISCTSQRCFSHQSS